MIQLVFSTIFCTRWGARREFSTWSSKLEQWEVRRGQHVDEKCVNRARNVSPSTDSGFEAMQLGSQHVTFPSTFFKPGARSATPHFTEARGRAILSPQYKIKDFNKQATMSSKEIVRLTNTLIHAIKYGCKLRFAHSLAVTAVYATSSKGHWKDRIIKIMKLTRDHGRVLATYAGLYRVLHFVLRKFTASTSPKLTFIAGLLAGSYVYGTLDINRPIQLQITLYVLSRIILAAYTSVTKDMQTKGKPWALMSGLIWGTVMYMNATDQDNLQSGLRSSMAYIYGDFDKVPQFLQWLGIC